MTTVSLADPLAPAPCRPSAALHRRHGALIALVLLAVYGTGINNPFQYDDIHSVAENPHIRSLANIPAFFVDPALFSADPRNAMYRPLVLISYALNHALSENRTWSYHLTNLGLHLITSLLVYGLVLQLGQPARQALLAAALFALSPLASEPVNYISSRSETLCAALVLLGFLAYLRQRPGAQVVAVGAFAAALLAKSVALALPPVLLAFELIYRPQRPGWRELVRRQSPFWLVGAGYLLVIREAVASAVFTQPVRGLEQHLLTQAKALVYYLRLLGMPQALSVEHQFALAAGPAESAVVAALGLLGTLVALLLATRARQCAFWVCWAGLALAPSTAVPLHILVNEHRLYLPLVAVAVLTAGLLGRLVQTHGRVGLVLVAAWLVMGAVLCWQRTQVWETPERLWADALRKGPRMPRPHLFVADGLQRSGRYEEALRHYALARTVYPEVLNGADVVVSFNNEAAALLALGRRAEAALSYRRALAIDPSYPHARQGLDALVALAEQHWEPPAQQLYREGLMLLVQNRPDQAVPVLQRSLAMQERLETYRALAAAYERLGQREQERRVYTILMQLAPASPFGQVAAAKLKEMEGEK